MSYDTFAAVKSKPKKWLIRRSFRIKGSIIRLVEKYVNGYWRSFNSEYHCRAALRIGTIALVLGEAKLEIRITGLITRIASVVLKPYLLSIALTIRFDDLHPINIAWIEAEDQVRVILYANSSRIRTWT